MCLCVFLFNLYLSVNVVNIKFNKFYLKLFC